MAVEFRERSRFILTAWLLVFASSAVIGCSEAGDVDAREQARQTVREIDQLQLPNGSWALSKGIIQLSFCRDRINSALLAESDELSRWRLVGDVSVFPPDRNEGLQQLADLYLAHDVLLYQLSGNFGSQIYQLAYRPNRPEPNIINAFAKIGRDASICYSSLDAKSR